MSAALSPTSCRARRSCNARGERIVEHGRYLLDLRHEAAVKHLDAVVDRLVDEFGVGYFKLDYNVTTGPGTDRDADSVGDGLLEHNRAHLAWLDGVLERHPDLILENCASGGMRSDFAMLSRLDAPVDLRPAEPAALPADRRRRHSSRSCRSRRRTGPTRNPR